jgi:glycyl-tRNA synthetase
MRDLARRVALTYLEQRKELEYPLLKKTDGTPEVIGRLKLSVGSQKAEPFLLEIGVEELPARDLDSAIEQLTINVPKLMDELHLVHGKLSISGTPRRLVVYIEDLSPHQPDREDLVKGPPAERAYGKDGMPTQAAIGFAKGKGVDLKALELREVDGGKYVVAVVKSIGRPTAEVLLESLPGLVAGIKFEKSMRWNASNVVFSRPIRWLVALLGGSIIPFEFAGLTAGRTSQGLRLNGSLKLNIPSAEQYFSIIQANNIILEVEERKKLIEAGVRQLAGSLKGEAMIPTELLGEVANLVEMPTPLLGSFDPEYLTLPKDVLISVMEKHQRYFPIQKKGKLMEKFIIVRNGDAQQLDLVREGNEHVVRARFADANFFVREDLKYRLEDFRPRLGTLIFQKKLGSMLDKSERIQKLTGVLIPLLGLDADEAIYAQRAAHLLKADLVTKMVVEMTSLQGVMGAEYALRSGENPAVAEAIREQYQPVPGSKTGLAVTLADRLDSLVGLFAVGLIPSGTKDPFGLRRAAIGVVQPLIEYKLPFDLRQGLMAAAAFQPIPVTDGLQTQVLEFLSGRLRGVLLDMGFKYDVVEAALAIQSGNPAGAAKAVAELTIWVKRKDWDTLLPGYARCVRITRDQNTRFVVDANLFSEEAEHRLFSALLKAEKQHRNPGSVDDFLTAFSPMISAVDEFFAKVLVMTEDEAVQKNRLGLLQRVTLLSEGTIDMSKLEGF